MATHNHGPNVECICDICICDKHQCPPTPSHGRPYDPNDLQSQYKRTYLGQSVQPHRHTRPAFSHNPLPFDGITTVQNDYINWPISARSHPGPLPTNLQVGGQFYPDTNYRDQYQPKNAPPPKLFKPAHNIIQGSPFDGTSTHRTDFPGYVERPRTSFAPKRTAELKPEDRDFQTDKRRNFNDKGVAVRQPYKPQSRLVQTGPFQGNSSHQTDFPQWNTKPATPFKPGNNFVNQPEDRDFASENRMVFTPKSGVARPALRQPPKLAQSAPFEGVSSNHNDFPHWKDARPADRVKRDRDSAAKPEDRDFKTENRKQYIPKQTDLQHPRPKGAVVIAPDDRDFATENSGFQDYGFQARKPFAPPKSQLPMGGAFNPDTTNRSSYVPHEGGPRQTFKPKQNLNIQPENRDFLTETKGNFQPYPVQVCPSELIKDRNLKEKSGHKMYRQTDSGGWIYDPSAPSHPPKKWSLRK